MIEDIEACLSVLKTLPNSEMLPSAGITWWSAVRDNDRVGFVARETLVSSYSHANALK